MKSGMNHINIRKVSTGAADNEQSEHSATLDSMIVFE